MIASFTSRKEFFIDSHLQQKAIDNNGVYMYVPYKDQLRGLPAGTPIYIGSANSASDEHVNAIFQFPHLHFHLYGYVPNIKHPKLRAYLQDHYPEHFI